MALACMLDLLDSVRSSNASAPSGRVAWKEAPPEGVCSPKDFRFSYNINVYEVYTSALICAPEPKRFRAWFPISRDSLYRTIRAFPASFLAVLTVVGCLTPALHLHLKFVLYHCTLVSSRLHSPRFHVMCIYVRHVVLRVRPPLNAGSLYGSWPFGRAFVCVVCVCVLLIVHSGRPR